MDDRDRAQLALLIDHATTAIGYARDQGRAWWKDRQTLDAVLMRITQVAEAAKRVSPQGLAEVSDVPWSNIKGIRGKIVHDYEQIDVVIIRGVVSRRLPSLITLVRRALAADEKRKVAEVKKAAQQSEQPRPRARRQATSRSPRK
jgi:uncharacterized protein with HEPN domain